MAEIVPPVNEMDEMVNTLLVATTPNLTPAEPLQYYDQLELYMSQEITREITVAKPGGSVKVRMGNWGMDVEIRGPKGGFQGYHSIAWAIIPDVIKSIRHIAPLGPEFVLTDLWVAFTCVGPKTAATKICGLLSGGDSLADAIQLLYDQWVVDARKANDDVKKSQENHT